jgi:hypothetical protein
MNRADAFESGSDRGSHVMWRDAIRNQIEGLHTKPVPKRDIRLRVHDLAMDHAKAVKRSANDVAGFAAEADIQTKLVTSTPDPAQAARLAALKTGESSLEQSMDTLAEQVRHSIEGFRSEVDQARQNKEGDDALTLVNFSWGHTPINGLLGLLKGPLHPNAPDNQLKQDMAKAFSPRPLAQVKTKERLAFLVDSLRAKMASEPHKQSIQQAKQELSESLSKAMDDNMLFFSSSGNMGLIGERFHAGDLSQNVVNDVEPLTVVGMANINEHDTFGDNEVNPLSSDGADFVTNGQELPVGEDGRTLTGTSFSTPLAMSVVHEMARINPSLSARSLYRILQHPFVFDSLRENREGKGMLDIEAAIELARDWAEFGDE